MNQDSRILNKIVNVFNYVLLINLFCYIFSLVVSNSNFYDIPYINSTFSSIIRISFIVVILCDAIKFLLRNYSLKECIIFCIFGLFFLFVYIRLQNALPILILLYIIGFKNVEHEKVFIASFLALLLSCILVFLFTFITAYGVQYQTMFRRGAMMNRYKFGFVSVVAFPDYFLSIITLYILIRKKPSIFEYIIILVLDIIIYLLVDARFPCLLMLFILVFNYFIDKINIKFFNFFSLITGLTFPLGAIFIYLITILYNPNNAIFSKFNEITTGRIGLMAKGISNWGTHLIGIGGNAYFSNNGEYNVIDSSYMHILLVDGLILLIIIIVFYMFFTYISHKINYRRMILVLFIIAIHSLFYEDIIYIDYHPIILTFLYLFIIYKKGEKIPL